MSDPKWLKRLQQRWEGGVGRWERVVLIEGRGAVGDEVTLCNSVTAVVSGGNREVKVMPPDNSETGQFDPTPFHILPTQSRSLIFRRRHKVNVNVVVLGSQDGQLGWFLSSFSPTLPK